MGLIALFFIYKEISFTEIISVFKNATLKQILIYVLIQIVLFLILTFRWLVVLWSQGIKGINIFKLNSYKVVGYSVSFLTPSAKIGGEPVRAGLLSTKYNIPFNKALSSVVIDKTLELTTSALFFILGGIFLLLKFVVAPELRNVIIAVVAFFVVIFGVFNYRMMVGKSFFYKIFTILRLDKLKSLKKFSKKLKDFEKLIIKFYHKDKKYFFYTILISFVSWVLMFFEYRIAGEIVGQTLSPMQIFLIFSFVGAAYLVPIPMALGALEAGQVSVFGLIKVKAAAGVGLSLIVRVKDMIISSIGMLLLLFYGLKFKEVYNQADRIDREVKRLEEVEDNGEKN